MPHRGNHILANTKAGDGVIAQEDGLVLRLILSRVDGIISLFKPAIAQRERLMARELCYGQRQILGGTSPELKSIDSRQRSNGKIISIPLIINEN
jgi:hypothetical protein